MAWATSNLQCGDIVSSRIVLHQHMFNLPWASDPQQGCSTNLCCKAEPYTWPNAGGDRGPRTK
eukprot:5184784-Alexandrium_andersonii.AAC.1